MKPLHLETDIEIAQDKSFLILMPIKYQITAFLQSNNVLQTLISHTAKLEKATKIANFVN